MPAIASIPPVPVSMPRFQDGGAVRRGSFYVERRADRELVEWLAQGEFCYVLAPRQIGKSSLRIRAEEKLREKGIRCASIDLTRIGTAGITAEEWYYSLIEEISGPLRLPRDPAEFWAHRGDLSPVHRFMRFLTKEVLGAIEGPVVISIDEIDMVLSLPFSRDDFFAAIRSVYNARAEDPIYGRLTFCLFGVAAPGELMEDPTHTPFNIGRAVRVSDFTLKEAEAFLPGLDGDAAAARALLEAVMQWSGGHPYMTQRLCSALVSQSPEERAGLSPEARVERLVKRLFLERGRLEDPNLAYAERRLGKTAAGPLRLEIFRIYRRLLYGAPVPARGDDPAQQELRLAGLVSERDDEGGPSRLVVRSRIFATVFDLAWVDENTTANPLAEPVAQWMRFQRQDDFLLHGVALEVALDWTRGRNDLSAEEREFVDRCVEMAERKKAEERAARDKRSKAILAAVLVLSALLAVGFWRERAHSAEVLKQQEALKQRLEYARKDLERVKAEAEQKVAESQKKEAALRDKADELEQQARENADLAEDLKQQATEARRRADEEHAAAAEAKKIADEAAEALKQSTAAVAEATKAVETERTGRMLAEKQLDEERKHRQRVEADLKATQDELQQTQGEKARLEKYQCWPAEDGINAGNGALRPQVLDAPRGPPGGANRTNAPPAQQQDRQQRPPR
jgi:hypothetical protein